MSTLPLYLYNTANPKDLEKPFKSINEGKVGIYCCGPTVYNYAHIGNLRTYFFEDILRRTLELSGYTVIHVMNITDVGHLQSDGDEGDDKMALASKREQKSPWDIAKFYEQEFFRHIDLLNIKRPDIICRATDHIPQMIAMVEKLIDRGHAYVVDGNAYYDVESFASYNDFARLQPQEQEQTDRVETDNRKRSQRDFVLWFSDSKYPNQIMKWDSPWGVGFPGWHIECSAMATEYLGQHFDIHCGGIDHIPVHHTNEIAQSEGCFGHDHGTPWVNYWLHGEFLNIDQGKMSKSSGHFLHLDQLIADGYDPLDYRCFLLHAHYRSGMSFSYNYLDVARKERLSFINLVKDWKYESKQLIADQGKIDHQWGTFFGYLCADLAMPSALSRAWDVARNPDLNAAEKLQLFLKFDQIFGLNLADELVEQKLPDVLQTLLDAREEARAAKKWAESDRLRDELLIHGVIVKDRKDGVDWTFA